MSDLSAKVIADLKRELAEAKAAADAVTESMGSEIMRLHGEIEQQRTRAEAAEQERRAEWERGKSAWDDGYAKSLARAKGAESELLAVRRQLSDLVSATNGFVGAYDEHGAFDGLLVGEDSWMTAMRDALREAKSRPHPVDPQDQLAAARKALEGVDVEALLHGESRRASCNSTIEQSQWCDNYQDAARARDELAKVDAALRNAAPALIAAAREALEP